MEEEPAWPAVAPGDCMPKKAAVTQMRMVCAEMLARARREKLFSLVNCISELIFTSEYVFSILIIIV